MSNENTAVANKMAMEANARCVAASGSIAETYSGATPVANRGELVDMAEALAALATAHGIDVPRCVLTATRRNAVDNEIFGSPRREDEATRSTSASYQPGRTPAWATPFDRMPARVQAEPRYHGLEALREATIARVRSQSPLQR